MSVFTVHYFDGQRSLPHNASIEISDGSIFLYDEEIDGHHPVIFPVSGCTFSKVGEYLFVFPEQAAGHYFQVHEKNLYYPILLTYCKQQKGLHNKLLGQKWLTLAGGLTAVFVIIYFFFVQLLPGIAIRFISPAQETVMGETIYKSIVADNEVDSFATKKLQAFANQLKLSNRYTIRVTVVKNENVNAFALPGGHIVVYSHILGIMEKPEEAAALLGHEATHINERHSLRSMLSGISWSLLKSIVFSGFGDIGNTVIRNAGSLQQLSYSRKLERVADAKGMELLVENHLDPNGMKMLMMALQKKYKGVLPALSFISSHPLTEERIKNADDFIRQHKNANFATDSSLYVIWKQLKEP